MSLFHTLRIKQLEDQLWLTREDKHMGILEEVRANVAMDVPVVVTAHFQETLDAFLTATEPSRINFTRPGSVGELPKILGNGHDADHQAAVVLVQVLTHRDFSTELDDHLLSRLHVAVLERHPLRDRDEKLVQALEKYVGKGTLSFHVDLEDPLIRRFTSEMFMKFLHSLGTEKAQPLSSPAISKALSMAQRSVKGTKKSEQDAGSMEAWFNLNVPD